jgi:hypothetical protein
VDVRFIAHTKNPDNSTYDFPCAETMLRSLRMRLTPRPLPPARCLPPCGVLALALCTTPTSVATGYGGWGTTLRAVEDLVPAVDRGRAAARDTPGVSTLLNALIGSTNFREGSMSV